MNYPALPNFPMQSTRSSSLVPSRQDKAIKRVEAEIMEAGLTIWAESEIERMEAFALERAVTTATDIEFSFFDSFIFAAGNSAVKQQLLARKLDLLARLQDQRIRRTFG